jgi:hypothetical protein
MPREQAGSCEERVMPAVFWNVPVNPHRKETATMRKFIKGLILLPMWPLIWHAEANSECGCLFASDGCQRRARKMREWFEN